MKGLELYRNKVLALEIMQKKGFQPCNIIEILDSEEAVLFVIKDTSCTEVEALAVAQME